MRIGVPTEIKNREYRVGMTPASVAEAVRAGHEVLVQSGAGTGINFHDSDYQEVGAQILPSADGVFEGADMIVKVKEPQPEECARLRPGQVLFTYLHLAADAPQAEALQASGATCIAYETVTDDRGTLPLLTPMSEVAGRMSIQVGAYCLQKAQGGIGTLLGGVPGVTAGNVVILGAGVAGSNAMMMAVGLQANVSVFDKSLARLRDIDMEYHGRVETLYSTKHAVANAVAEADLVVGAVLLPGAAAPKLVTREMVRTMRPGSVLVDISIDQGGCFETSRPTSHDDPTYVEEGAVHYCVTNMPGAVARTSTLALNNATLPFILALAGHGAEEAMKRNVHLARGLNVYKGEIVHPAVAEALNKPGADNPFSPTVR